MRIRCIDRKNALLFETFLGSPGFKKINVGHVSKHRCGRYQVAVQT